MLFHLKKKTPQQLLPTTTRKEVSHKKNLDVWPSLGKLGHLQHPASLLGGSGSFPAEWQRPVLDLGWEGAENGLLGRAQIFQTSPCAEPSVTAIVLLVSRTLSPLPVGTRVFDPCSCWSVFLVGSTLVLCLCYFFGMSLPFGRAYPRLHLIFKASPKVPWPVESHTAVMARASPSAPHRQHGVEFDFTRRSVVYCFMSSLSYMVICFLTVRKHSSLTLCIYHCENVNAQPTYVIF